MRIECIMSQFDERVRSQFGVGQNTTGRMRPHNRESGSSVWCTPGPQSRGNVQSESWAGASFDLTVRYNAPRNSYSLKKMKKQCYGRTLCRYSVAVKNVKTRYGNGQCVAPRQQGLPCEYFWRDSPLFIWSAKYIYQSTVGAGVSSYYVSSKRDGYLLRTDGEASRSIIQHIH